MKDIRYFIGFHLPEITALGLTACILGVGSYLAWVGEAVWLNRFGALVTVVGVVLAVWRYHERAAREIKKAITDDGGAFIRTVIAVVEEEQGRALVAEERIQVAMQADRLRHETRFKEQIDASAATDSQRVKMWEVGIVIFGTLVNGFGDVAITIAKAIV
jgi:hypothetical protein